MTARAYIFGNGGHAAVIASFLPVQATHVVRQVSPAAHDELAEAAFFADPPCGPIYLGIGENAVRRKVFEKLKAAGLTVATCVAPTAFVAGNAVLEEGALICAGAVVGPRTRIGANAIVNTLSGVDHDCTIGAHSQVTVGVTLAGGVRLGRNCFVGLKTGIFPGVTIGDDVVIRGGSLVVRDLPDNVVAGGNPAEILRRA